MKLAFSGDLSLHNRVSPDVFAQLRGTLPCSLVVNLESVFVPASPEPQPARQKILLPAPEQRAALLNQLPVAAVCVGNNHITDYGNTAAQLTIDLCAQHFPVFGAGRVGEPFHRLVLGAGPESVALIAYCQGDTRPLSATPDIIGPRMCSRQQWAEDLAWARTAARHVVVMLHWGDEDTHCPRADQPPFARELVDTGADLVIGSHAHAAQGYEQYRGKYIFCCLGHLLFPDVRVTVNGKQYRKVNVFKNRWGLLPVFEIRHTGIELVDLYFVEDTHAQPRLTKRGSLARSLRRYSGWLHRPDLEAHSRRILRRSQLLRPLEAFCVSEDRLRILGEKLSSACSRWTGRTPQTTGNSPTAD